MNNSKHLRPIATLLIGTLLSINVALAKPNSGEPAAARKTQNTIPVSALETPDKFRELVREVWQYAYPLVLMDTTMQQVTNVPDADAHPERAPVNQWAHYRQYPGSEYSDVVRVNFDTLYSMAWLDVSAEPMILSVPDMGDRYHIFPMLDMWTDVFAVVGSRTTGSTGGHFAIASMDWEGELPEGVELVRAPTPRLWILGRTQTHGPEDFENVHALQDQYGLTPLSAWGTDYNPPNQLPVNDDIDNVTRPQRLVQHMSGVEMLSRFAELLKEIPPHANDNPIRLRMRALGLQPGESFDTSSLDEKTTALINQGAKEAFADMRSVIAGAELGIVKDGWNWTLQPIGTYGTAYRYRAVVAWAGLGANLVEDAFYPNGFADSQGRPTTGEHRYTIRFDEGEIPPANAFWSLTMYDMDGFQIENPIDRFSVSSHNDLHYGDDGSVEIIVQHEMPENHQEVNWLPAPEGQFQVMLRVFSPKPEVLRSEWTPPAIERMD